MATEKYEHINQSNYKLHAPEHAKFNLNSTLFLAYRDINIILKKHLIDRTEKQKFKLLDYGCGTGLSTLIYTETLAQMGFDVEIFGIDINLENLSIAKIRIPQGNFVHFNKIDEVVFDNDFDLIICNFVLLELPQDQLIKILKKLNTLITPNGILISTNASRQSYNCSNRWHTLINNFPQNQPKDLVNKKIEDGQQVSLAVRDPISGIELFKFHDFFYSSKLYTKVFKESGFNIAETYKPLGKKDDGIPWQSEKNVSPYKIHILYPASDSLNLLLNTSSKL